MALDLFWVEKSLAGDGRADLATIRPVVTEGLEKLLFRDEFSLAEELTKANWREANWCRASRIDLMWSGVLGPGLAGNTFIVVANLVSTHNQLGERQSISLRLPCGAKSFEASQIHDTARRDLITALLWSLGALYHNRPEPFAIND